MTGFLRSLRSRCWAWWCKIANNPQPERQADRFLRGLARLNPTEHRELIDAMVRSIEQARAAAPGDHALRIALLHGMMLQGRSTDARALARGLWQVRGSLRPTDAQNFFQMLDSLGMYKEFLECVGTQPLTRNYYRFKQQMNALWRLGRLDDLKRFTASARIDANRAEVDIQNLVRLYEAILVEIERVGLAVYFSDYQKLISEEIGERQLFAEVMISPDEDADFELDATTAIYVSADYKERVTFEDRIRERLRDRLSGSASLFLQFQSLLPAIVLSHAAISFAEQRAA